MSDTTERSRRLDKSDLIGGCAAIAIGAVFIIGSFQYDVGTARRMGPGYFPIVIGCLTTFLGIAIAASALGHQGRAVVIAWRPLIAVIAAVAAFALTIRSFGLLPATALAVSMSTLAEHGVSPRETALLAFGMMAAAWLVFIVLLRLPIPIMRWPT